MTVEMEANGDSRSTYERDPSLVGSLDSSHFSIRLFLFMQLFYFPVNFVATELNIFYYNIEFEKKSIPKLQKI
jgi:hypothetical protein